MEKKYLIGNLKMNMNEAALISYFKYLTKTAKKANHYVGVALPSIYLPLAKKYLKSSKVNYGAQNMHFENTGAYTGEISAQMLKDYNVQFSLIGHSERRSMYNETDETVNKKVHKALSESITPVVCVGETLDERKANATKKVVKRQVLKALKDINPDQISKIMFAYEPVWAIGTGISATSKEANQVTKYIKSVVAKKYDLAANDIIVLYGGSMNEKNASELLNMSDIDGGLIGGASLKAQSFSEIINIK